jgi:hypothetical protein
VKIFLKFFQITSLKKVEMARHRKIPGKKHKGVKDPEKQRAKREEILKPKVIFSSTILTVR